MKRGIDNLEVRGQSVFVRVDANVPLTDGEIRDDTRLRAVQPTLDALRARGARVILAAHLGRPRGHVDRTLSMAPVATYLSGLLGVDISMAPDSVGPDVSALVRGLRDGEILMLENLRFHPGEERNEPEFAASLANLADCYIGDAFGAAHRAHASTVGVPGILPSVAGPLMCAEIEALERATRQPDRPYVAVLGGGKTSDKIGVLEQLASVVDVLMLGGGLANTFLKNFGHHMGRSLVEPGQSDVVAAVREIAKKSSCRLMIPTDVLVAASPVDDASVAVVEVDAIPCDQMVLDIGPDTAAMYTQILGSARTVIWNGPVGVYERAAFAKGTRAIVRALADSPGFVVAAGGDAAAAVQTAGLAHRMGHLSTGGGAALEFIEGRDLPGLVVLPDA